MSGLTITSDDDRRFIAQQVIAMPPGTKVFMVIDPASEAQRKKMWACLNEIAKKVPHVDMDGNARFYAAEQWKILFMHACGQEVEMMPSLDRSTFLPYDGRSSHMNAKDMNELISFIDAWAAQNDVKLKEVP